MVKAIFSVNAKNYNKEACEQLSKIKPDQKFYDDHAVGTNSGVKIEMSNLSDIPTVYEVKREIANTLGMRRDDFSIVSYRRQTDEPWKEFNEQNFKGKSMVEAGFIGKSITENKNAWDRYLRKNNLILSIKFKEEDKYDA